MLMKVVVVIFMIHVNPYYFVSCKSVSMLVSSYSSSNGCNYKCIIEKE